MRNGKDYKPQPKQGLPLYLKILIGLLAVLLAVVGGAYLYLNVMLDRIDRSTVAGDDTLSVEQVMDGLERTDEADSDDMIRQMQTMHSASQDYAAVEDTRTILLVGSDRRDDSWNGLSDAIILMTINHNTKKIHLASLMRGMYVCIPRESGETWFGLNAAYSWGGIELLEKTIEKNFKVEIDDYMIVDFDGFISSVDLVGGIDVELTQTEADVINQDVPGAGVSAGLTHLNGETALSYARIRKIDNDFVRTGRQRTVITELLHKAADCSVSTLGELAGQLFPLVKTNMSNAEILSLALDAGSLSNYEIDQLMLPIENMDGVSYEGKMYVSGAEVYSYDVDENLDALHKFMEG